MPVPSGLRISDEHFLSVYRQSRILDCLAGGWFEFSLVDAEPQAMRLEPNHVFVRSDRSIGDDLRRKRT